MRAFGVAIVLAALLAASPAAADWQFTKWGMTPDQVIAASGGKAVSSSGEPNWTVKIAGGYRVGDVSFADVSFRFDDTNRLHRITLHGQSRDYDAVAAAVSGAVGQPAFSRSGRLVFLDRGKGNTIDLRAIGDDLFVTYTPVDAGF